MATVILVHRRVDEVGRRLGYLEVEDKLADDLIAKGAAKLARRNKRGRPVPLPAKGKAKKAKASEPADVPATPVDVIDVANASAAEQTQTAIEDAKAEDKPKKAAPAAKDD